jgi:hypothetical protein
MFLTFKFPQDHGGPAVQAPWLLHACKAPPAQRKILTNAAHKIAEDVCCSDKQEVMICWLLGPIQMATIYCNYSNVDQCLVTFHSCAPVVVGQMLQLTGLAISGDEDDDDDDDDDDDAQRRGFVHGRNYLWLRL